MLIFCKERSKLLNIHETVERYTLPVQPLGLHASASLKKSRALTTGEWRGTLCVGVFFKTSPGTISPHLNNFSLILARLEWRMSGTLYKDDPRSEKYMISRR